MLKLVRGTLKGATKQHGIGFHDETADPNHPEADPIYPAPGQPPCLTSTTGVFSIWVESPKRYKVSVDRTCWARPQPAITTPADVLPVPVPTPPGLSLTLVSDCTNREPPPPGPLIEVLLYDSQDLVAAGVTEPRVYLNGYKWELQKEEMDASDGTREVEIALVVYVEEGQALPFLNGVSPMDPGEGQS